MDALDFIKQDHDRFREMFDRYEEIPIDDADSKRALMDDLIELVVQHSFMEEEAFYPVVMDAVPEAEDDVREEIEEHHLVEVVMAEIIELDAGDPQFDAKVEVFAENLLHHLEEEEEELFPLLREKLSADKLTEMRQGLEDAKTRAPTDPDPERGAA